MKKKNPVKLYGHFFLETQQQRTGVTLTKIKNTLTQKVGDTLGNGVTGIKDVSREDKGLSIPGRNRRYLERVLAQCRPDVLVHRQGTMQGSCFSSILQHCLPTSLITNWIRSRHVCCSVYCQSTNPPCCPGIPGAVILPTRMPPFPPPSPGLDYSAGGGPHLKQG